MRSEARNQFLVDADVGDAEVARQKLDMRKRVALAGGQDAGDGGQIGHRFGQQINAVGAEIIGAGDVRAHVQDTAGQARVERPKADADLFAE